MIALCKLSSSETGIAALIASVNSSRRIEIYHFFKKRLEKKKKSLKKFLFSERELESKQIDGTSPEERSVLIVLITPVGSSTSAAAETINNKKTKKEKKTFLDEFISCVSKH